MHPTLIDNYDLKVFLSIDEDKQKERILKRNGSIKLKRFLTDWIPMENRYFNEMRIIEKCNLVLKV
jgi:uridine kinase